MRAVEGGSVEEWLETMYGREEERGGVRRCHKDAMKKKRIKTE